jgi:hypothetical protein
MWKIVSSLVIVGVLVALAIPIAEAAPDLVMPDQHASHQFTGVVNRESLPHPHILDAHGSL